MPDESSLGPDQYEFVRECLNISASALCVYEYALTFNDEVRYIWKASFSVPAILFYVSRYSALLNTIWVFLEIIKWPGRNISTCEILLRSGSGLFTGLLISAAVFAAIRVYAITGSAIWLFMLTLVLYSINPAILLYTDILFQPTIRSGYCTTRYPKHQDVYAKWAILAGAAAIASHGLILLATWLATSSTAGIRQLYATKETLSTVLVQNGGIYFMLLLIGTVIGLVAGRQIEVKEGIFSFLTILTSILMSRFIFNLRRVADANATEPSGGFGIQTIVFADSPGGVADTQAPNEVDTNNDEEWEDTA